MDNYNIAEIFEIAEQIERNGADFYKQAVEKVECEDAKKFLQSLADMEGDHEIYFNALKKQFELHKTEEFSDYDNQSLSYLQAIVDGGIFDTIKPLDNYIKGNDSVRSLMEVALEFERNTVIYFCSIKELLQEEEDKEKLNSIIREEISHIAMLSLKLKELALPEE